MGRDASGALSTRDVTGERALAFPESLAMGVSCDVLRADFVRNGGVQGEALLTIHRIMQRDQSIGSPVHVT